MGQCSCSDKQQYALSAVIFSISSNLILVVLKGLAGLLGNSSALIADAIESMADVVSSILLYAGIKFAHKPPDKNHPYGHGKIEPLLTLVIVIFLLFSAGLISFHSIGNIGTRHEAPAAWTLLILLPIIIWKEFTFRTIIKKAKALNSSTLKAEAWHQRSDAFTSAAAFIGIATAVMLGEGYENADDLAALVAAAVIVYNCYHLLRPAIAELMDEHAHDKMVIAIYEQSQQVKGILDIETCYVRKSGIFYWVDLHAIVDGNLTVREGHDLAHQLKDHLRKKIPEIQDVLIHIEPD